MTDYFPGDTADARERFREATIAWTAAPKHPTARWVVHNLIAHPLLILCPPLGRWLHERTTT